MNFSYLKPLKSLVSSPWFNFGDEKGIKIREVFAGKAITLIKISLIKIHNLFINLKMKLIAGDT